MVIGHVKALESKFLEKSRFKNWLYITATQLDMNIDRLIIILVASASIFFHVKHIENPSSTPPKMRHDDFFVVVCRMFSMTYQIFHFKNNFFQRE